ncbi:6180_t:CDS:1 [Funneliformis geosporum]|uniref:11843_t:CDS:1 n=1 Tax=Funneliformis geosporum TaxID=1117311 RepID=A0A9W4WNP1_9GLOM|nr:6180_t:CDS:1 [Funneliformis geosporum]CAI2167360.1 11843_t:CDS:1 [Funneliformis geosporum]
MKLSIFDKDSERFILRRMEELKYQSKRCYAIIAKELSKEIPRKKPYTSKQIQHHWENSLKPNLCKVPLSNDEKDFIVKWAEENQRQDGVISLTKLIPVIKKQFGNLRSENQIKNFWYPRKRQLDETERIKRIKQQNSIPPAVLEPEPDPPQFNFPNIF